MWYFQMLRYLNENLCSESLSFGASLLVHLTVWIREHVNSEFTVARDESLDLFVIFQFSMLTKTIIIDLWIHVVCDAAIFHMNISMLFTASFGSWTRITTL